MISKTYIDWKLVSTKVTMIRLILFMNVLYLIQIGHIIWKLPKTKMAIFTPVALFFNSANRWLPDAVGGFIDFPVERLFRIVKIFWICYFEIGLFLTL